jgi:formamidopyrimidine-DNA glycosylase
MYAEEGGMNGPMKKFELKANMALVVRAPLSDIQDFAKDLTELLQARPAILVVHAQMSGSKLWIKEGGDMNEEGSDFDR